MRILIPFEGAYYFLLPCLAALVDFMEAFASEPAVFPGRVAKVTTKVFNKVEMSL